MNVDTAEDGESPRQMSGVEGQTAVLAAIDAEDEAACRAALALLPSSTFRDTNLVTQMLARARHGRSKSIIDEVIEAIPSSAFAHPATFLPFAHQRPDLLPAIMARVQAEGSVSVDIVRTAALSLCTCRRAVADAHIEALLEALPESALMHTETDERCLLSRAVRHGEVSPAVIRSLIDRAPAALLAHGKCKPALMYALDVRISANTDGQIIDMLLERMTAADLEQCGAMVKALRTGPMSTMARLAAAMRPGAFLDTIPGEFKYLLHFAVAHCSADMVAALVPFLPSDCFGLRDGSGRTPLLLATRQRKGDTIKVLLPNMTPEQRLTADYWGQTALSFAQQRNLLQLVALLQPMVKKAA